MSRTGVLWLAFFTIALFGAGGAAIIYFADRLSFATAFFPMAEALSTPESLLLQLTSGIVYGVLAAMLLWQVVLMDYLLPTRRFFVRLIGRLDLRTSDIWFISLCAGIGEEAFFRGGIQPFAGVWLTGFIFVAIHGYLSPTNRPLLVYGIFMVLVIAGVGYMSRHLGLLSAIVAHVLIDVYLFSKLSKRSRVAPEESED